MASVSTPQSLCTTADGSPRSQNTNKIQKLSEGAPDRRSRTRVVPSFHHVVGCASFGNSVRVSQVLPVPVRIAHPPVWRLEVKHLSLQSGFAGEMLLHHETYREQAKSFGTREDTLGAGNGLCTSTSGCTRVTVEWLVFGSFFSFIITDRWVVPSAYWR